MNISELYNIYKQSTGVSIDTRTITQGNIFFALAADEIMRKGHAKEALSKGASFVVEDNALEQLQTLAKTYRDSFSIPFFALTGSNGKTTTKELIRDVLKTTYRISATEGNLNNHIGVPLTILSIPADTEIAVIEMGANHQGEIAVLCEIAKPTHGLITNIGKAHIGEMGGIEGVTKTKGELFEYLKNNSGKFFLNSDDSRLAIMAAKNMQIVAGSYSAHDVAEYHSQLLGAHNKQNIAAARTVGLFFNVSEENIKKAVSAYAPHAGRSEWLMWQGNKVLFDAYNANPSSMSIALQSFAELPEIAGDNKLAILGGMRELGTYQYIEHATIFNQVEKLIVDQKLQSAYFVGPEFDEVKEKLINPVSESITFFKNRDDLKKFFDGHGFPKHKTIFLKASKGSEKEPMLKTVLSW